MRRECERENVQEREKERMCERERERAREKEREKEKKRKKEKKQNVSNKLFNKNQHFCFRNFQERQLLQYLDTPPSYPSSSEADHLDMSFDAEVTFPQQQR